VKKLIIALGLASTILSAAPANAGNNPWPVIGGVVGGLLLGEVLSDHHRHGQTYYEQQPVYVQPRAAYRQCETYYRSEFDPYYGGYRQVPYTECWWTRY
jgi:hypothetical protein